MTNSATTGSRHTPLQLAHAAGLPILLVAGVVALIIPLLFSGSRLFTWSLVAVWALFAMATNVLFGWAGLISFGQAAFFGIGAYALALLNEHAPGIPALLMLPMAGLIAGLIGAIFATMALRTSGAEFAILTLVLAQVLWLLTFRVSALKGEDGFHGLFAIKVITKPLTSDLSLWYYTIGVVAVCIWMLWLLHRSSAGMAMRAIRDDPFRAAALGVGVRGVQIRSFAACAAFSAIAGALFAQGQGVVSPGVLGFAISGEVLVACLIGGMGRFAGPILGALLLVWAKTLANNYVEDSAIFVGLLLLITVVALPQGLVSLPTRIKSWRAHRSSAAAQSIEAAEPLPTDTALEPAEGAGR